MIDLLQKQRLFVLLILSGFLISATLTYFIARLARRVGVMDVPNERSSHSVPVPRGGGISIVVAYLSFLLADIRFDITPIDSSILWAFVVGGVIVSAIGALDDSGHVDAKWRFSAHTVAVISALYLLPEFPEISFFGIEFNSNYVAFLALTLLLVWSINLFNFMDGIDGIASVELITVLAGGSIILAVRGNIDWQVTSGFLCASVGGFLVWNWSPARVFMGDACSGFLGFTLGLFAVSTSASGVLNIWTWLILFGVFLADSTTTLVIRMARGDNWASAHNSHAYQIISRRLGSHQKVVFIVLLVNIVWLYPLAYVAAEYPYWAFLTFSVAVLPLTLIAFLSGAGRPDQQDFN